MKIINSAGLPEAVVNSIASFFAYTRGESDFSVTDLLDPPRIVILKERHREELEEDITNLFWSLLGTAVHNILEQHGAQNDLQEHRLYTTVSDSVISGKCDVYSEGIIRDYKLTSAYSVKNMSKEDAWIWQLNYYGELFRRNSFPVTGLQIFAMMRDWQKRQATYSKDYPNSPMQIIDIPLLDSNVVSARLEQAVIELECNSCLADDALDLCTTADMWQKEPQYVVTIGKKNYLEPFNNDLTSIFAKYDKSKVVKLAKRVHPRVRCNSYCLVNKFCNQFKAYNKITESEEIVIEF